MPRFTPRFTHHRLRAAVFLVPMSGLFLAGCTANNNGYYTTQGAGVGALGGAAAGAAIGAVAGSNVARSALIGAGVGVLAGGAVGAYMDSQEEELRRNLAGTNVSVQRQGDSLLLVMPANVTFAFDSSDIAPTFQPTLTEVATTLRNNPQTYIQVHGHTDAVGSETYNQGLSERRAQSVVNFLLGQGILPERLYWQGHGETQPIATNDTAAGRQQNRRVEIRIIPHTA
ncbi:OmpA family protein [Roseospira marina]|uniref:OmpA family protein n=1 Tax=Roseospira marina TaxID=140057 RepID=A0A5M6IIH5_9PROT|nr:OmpA family protein [Roseospira marina]KAA5607485.1 OmpA family protein [Roseospira marina]MBB4312334.1 outer membrane protein OmpA-like peptidoglycan-associated protein [Roseospira marina]MBB5085650.1 outer membrane protein OmpA-like peptidoglycan-associated protein [Roseospira marina]